MKSASQSFALAAVLWLSFASAGAQTTVSVNLDYAEGKYGERTKSTSWTMPLIVKQQIGDFGFKLNLPYIRATGTAASGGDRFASSRQTQEGFGDLVATATWGLLDDEGAQFAVDLGAKAKLAVADKRQDLLTTGRNDYSLLADVLRNFGNLTGFVTLGRTWKGDPAGINYRNPWFGTIGLSRKLQPDLSLGAMVDYRQKLTPRGDPINEMTLFVERKFSSQLKVQGYLVRGFSDSSPDIGAGITVSARF
ncbi:MAG: hypothetical protein JNK96_07370 [Betaproteobacteria bacterium]|jgi:hypothetical protein|nr:hypothetical protein [Betaproteobacteria bacterium]HMV20364.1 hypothetical protein [Rhodocyclaceae bacterium]HNE44060.1 hypothetical protein [Rhodocyclaceae bacterium]HNM21243.1 hypothetical protein [Rhodocyclaceae bacterium]HNM80320.1 hypothetical protein [Rhodocyclaceae bacterium]